MMAYLIIGLILFFFFSIFKYFSRHFKSLESKMEMVLGVFEIEPEIQINKEALLIANKWIREYKVRNNLE